MIYRMSMYDVNQRNSLIVDMNMIFKRSINFFFRRIDLLDLKLLHINHCDTNGLRQPLRC